MSYSYRKEVRLNHIGERKFPKIVGLLILRSNEVKEKLQVGNLKNLYKVDTSLDEQVKDCPALPETGSAVI